jgi:predicted dehydrogenase
MMRVGVIGYGYWGPNLVRNFAERPDAQVVVVADRRPERLDQVQRRYPTIRVTTDPSDLIADPAVDAVVIRHTRWPALRAAMRRLRAGKACAGGEADGLTSDEASRLIDEAARRRLVLMVDHTFIYTGAVQKMRELVGSGELGDSTTTIPCASTSAVSAGCGRALGSGRPRSLDHGFRLRSSPVASPRPAAHVPGAR